ncbi:protein-tyrosine phosphatase family protein [Vibrio anguillarum]|uniref:protein-tyrosine phosphatase family protein n=1 Tax=Vibrio anguillarum TaxID=55601 RepID=UPI002FE46013
MCFEAQLENLFFVTNSVAGRCGPDKVMWDLEELWSSGVRAIISVNDGESVHISRLKAIGFAYEHIPLSSNAPVQSGDFEVCLDALPRIIKFIEQNETQGKVVVHCKSGKDRTGLALAAYLLKSKGFGVEESMAAVKDVRDIAFSAPDWDWFTEKVLVGLPNT